MDALQPLPVHLAIDWRRQHTGEHVELGRHHVGGKRRFGLLDTPYRAPPPRHELMIMRYTVSARRPQHPIAHESGPTRVSSQALQFCRRRVRGRVTVDG